MDRVKFQWTFWSGVSSLDERQKTAAQCRRYGTFSSSDRGVGYDSASGCGACEQLADDGLLLASRGERGFVALSLWMQGKR